jgi:4-hydroxy-tetrahydrodipicolinate synthase
MQPISGIVPPLATPFDAEGQIQPDLLRADVRQMIGAGVHGVVVGGSTGEGHTLAPDELRSLLGAAVEEAGGRIPVIAGLIVDSTRQAFQAIDALRDLDLAALQVTPVHYVFKPDDDGTLEHFAAIAQHAGQPVMIYNVVPWNYCSSDLLVRIIRDVDGVIGVKQSGADLELVADLLLRIGDEAVVMSAVDALMYPSFAIGVHGAIAAILTAVPELCVQLWHAVRGDDHRTARDLHVKLLRVWTSIKGDNLPANTKYAMQLQDRPAGFPRAPMPPTSEHRKPLIRAALQEAGPIS